ncbi:MAG: hypothetical protein GYB50_15430 [Rhodobacteraceae bacterium]|uniref:hypothetical protein n=1 Tax=Salipiger thiooxidans TaxID=282683 RepID=UPI001A8F836C|nr:hypothetical protein [Salipiger thiooxidans]MBN8188739.1 hypothetical protein [Salipiger thiooxidans]MBR9839268.1 hypothetical protein [Paracoccaceae bacterium]
MGEIDADALGGTGLVAPDQQDVAGVQRHPEGRGGRGVLRHVWSDPKWVVVHMKAR